MLCDQSACPVFGGDWICTVDLNVESEEPPLQSSTCLARLVSQLDLIDIWRLTHPAVRQYTWVKMLNNRVRAARLDFICHRFLAQGCSRVLFHPGFTDHHLITLDFCLSPTVKSNSYWRFSVNLLQDSVFCEKCVFLGTLESQKEGVCFFVFYLKSFWFWKGFYLLGGTVV